MIHNGAVLSKALAEAIPNATLEIMDGWGHVMFYERPAEFNSRIIRFLNGAAPRR